MKEYTVVVERESDGRYSVYVPDLLGCASWGDSYEEALAHLREAIECHLDALRADGLPVPEPRTSATATRVTAG